MCPRIMCHHHTLTDEERELITGKVTRLKKFYDRIAEVSVILDAAKNGGLCEILIYGPQLNLHLKHQAENMRTAFEEAINKAERSLQKTKDKKWGDKMHRRRNVTIRRFNPMDFDLSVGPPHGNGEPHATPGSPYELLEPKPMSLEEAHLQLKARATGLLVFMNSQTEKINVLHRNSHNEVELVEFDGTEPPLEELAELALTD